METGYRLQVGWRLQLALSDVGAGSSQEKCSKGRQSLCPGLETSSRCLGTDSCADRGSLRTERKEISPVCSYIVCGVLCWQPKQTHPRATCIPFA